MMAKLLRMTIIVKGATLIMRNRSSIVFPSVLVRNVGTVEKGVKMENKVLNESTA
jgi:hypothetical protein